MLRMASILCLVAAVLAAGCGERREKVKPAPQPSLPTIRLKSPAFAAGGTLPRRFTCDGEGAAPPLTWTGVPRSARELALVMEDPDASSGAFVHWVVLAIPPTARGLAEGAKPATLRLGRASSGKVGYEPPCPPKGGPPHDYVFKLYVLRRPTSAGYGASPAQARGAILAASVAQGTLTARFGR